MINGPAQEILAPIAYAKMPLINTCADTFKGIRGLSFSLSLYQQSYFVFAINEGEGEYAHMDEVRRSLRCSLSDTRIT